MYGGVTKDFCSQHIGWLKIERKGRPLVSDAHLHMDVCSPQTAFVRLPTDTVIHGPHAPPGIKTCGNLSGINTPRCSSTLHTAADCESDTQRSRPSSFGRDVIPQSKFFVPPFHSSLTQAVAFQLTTQFAALFRGLGVRIRKEERPFRACD